MRKIIFGIIACCIIATSSLILAQTEQLPTVSINGATYYYYDTQKGESLYAIANKHGWDPQLLMSLNPDAAKKLKANQRIFYPADKVVESADERYINSRPLTHILAPGENIYTVASLYGISLDSLYALNPKAAMGTISGDTLIVRPATAKDDMLSKASKIVYKIEAGDTPVSVARKFNTSVASIFLNNAKLTADTFTPGHEIIIVPNDIEVKTRIVSNTGISSVDTYKVKKDESWYSIAKAHNLTQEELMAANPGITEIKKNVLLTIPVRDTLSHIEEYLDIDQREYTPDGLSAIIDSVKQMKADNVNISGANVGIIVNDATSKLSMEFIRGFLVALDEFKYTPYVVNMSVIDMKTTPQLLNDSVLSKFNLIIATNDKNIPQNLQQITDSLNIPLVNVFDVKHTGYLTHPNQIQMLPTSDDFNDVVASSLVSTLSNQTVIVLGETDPQDAVIEYLKIKIPDNIVTVATLDELRERDFAEEMSYAIYCSDNGRNRDEIKNKLAAISEIRTAHPMANISTVGRASWVQQINALENQLCSANTIIPSRFYFDKGETASRRFIDEYSTLFRHAPIASSPMFAVAGYDVARFFIPAIEMGNISEGKFEPMSEYTMLQTDFNLNKVPGGGYANRVCYLIKMKPYGVISKELIK